MREVNSPALRRLEWIRWCTCCSTISQSRSLQINQLINQSSKYLLLFSTCSPNHMKNNLQLTADKCKLFQIKTIQTEHSQFHCTQLFFILFFCFQSLYDWVWCCLCVCLSVCLTIHRQPYLRNQWTIAIKSDTMTPQSQKCIMCELSGVPVTKIKNPWKLGGSGGMPPWIFFF